MRRKADELQRSLLHLTATSKIEHIMQAGYRQGARYCIKLESARVRGEEDRSLLHCHCSFALAGNALKRQHARSKYARAIQSYDFERCKHFEIVSALSARILHSRLLVIWQSNSDAVQPNLLCSGSCLNLTAGSCTLEHCCGTACWLLQLQ